jgi:hypothetical protein
MTSRTRGYGCSALLPANPAYVQRPSAWPGTGFHPDRARVWWFPSAPAMFDMFDVTFGEHEGVHVFIVIAFIRAQMLLRRRAFDGNMNDQIIQRPFIMLVGDCNPDRQWSTALIHQQVDFTALLGSIGGIGSGITPAQRSST